MHASLSDVLSDLVQNSVEAGASEIQVVFFESPAEVGFSVDDNGKGMDKAVLERASDPFWSDGEKHPGRRVGLGIPFLRQIAEQTGGRADIDSVPAEGTKVKAVFPASHLDLPPSGNIVLLWLQCLTFDGDFDLSIHRSRKDAAGGTEEYRIDRAEVSEALGGLEDAGALGLLREYLISLEEPFY